MTQINSYKDLTVWQAGMDLVDVCFDIVEALPPKYRFIFCDHLLLKAVHLVEPVGKMLNGLVESLERKQHDCTKP